LITKRSFALQLIRLLPRYSDLTSGTGRLSRRHGFRRGKASRDPSVLLQDETTESIQPNIVDWIGEVVSPLARIERTLILKLEQYLNSTSNMRTGSSR
jgi:ABC-type histidine transport system ATPase subunit